jgi:IS605 OrfB family transposase
MTISGRHDASGGNFVFRYDPEKRLLKYRSMSGADIYLPCEFPYGQALVERAVSLPECSVINGKEVRRHAVCWGVEDCGNSFIVKCTVEIDMPDMNCCRSDGVVAFDTNADNISFAETDASGNLLRHGIIHFDLEGKSSEQTEYILSSALETVFRYAESVRKPVVLEKLEDIKQESLYRGKRLNRVLSMFACSKITELAMSKSVKYRLHVIGVNPAFTSQMGKVKYMRRHGLSVHEAAAYVIARRGMGLSEKLPAQLMELIPAKKRDRHHWSHWRYLHNKLKEIPWQSCYGKIINAGSVNAA